VEKELPFLCLRGSSFEEPRGKKVASYGARGVPVPPSVGRRTPLLLRNQRERVLLPTEGKER